MKNIRLHWKSTDLYRPLARVVPTRSGVYAILAAKRVWDFPAQMDLLYIGKSKNLRRRFLEHADPWSEHNRNLKQVKLSEPIEFWHAFVDEESLDIIERELISKAKPSANILTYGDKK